MRTYPSFTVSFRGQPWLNMVCEEQKDVEQFILDWCSSNNIRPSSDEWLIQPVAAVVSKEMLGEICSSQPVGGMSDYAPYDKRQAIPGRVEVKINPKCWG